MGESIASEVIAASLGGAFSASALYPLEVLKTKMQADSKQTCDNADQTAPCKNDNEERKEESGHDTADTNGASTVQKRLLPDKKKSTTMIDYARDMYAQNGLVPFYAGIETSAFQSAVEKALYYFAYTAMKNVYSFFAGSEKHMGTTVNLILGCFAEWAHLPITLPLDCWTTQIQTGDNGNKKPLAILMSMLSEGDGIRGMYKGIQAYYVLCLKPAIQNTVFEQIRRILLIRKKLLNRSKQGQSSSYSSLNEDTLTASEAFILGMVARTIATVVVFPYLRAKVMLQSQKKNDSGGDGASNVDPPNIPAMILKMYSNGGLGECFQGIGPELTRGVFSAALMLMCKEKISYVVHKALQGGRA